jgi:hypothetical protein
MSPAQTKLYWREWAAVRRVDPKADRHALTVKALGRMKSSKEFGNADLDKVLGVFRAISKPSSVNAQMRQLNQPRTRLLKKITAEQLPCLAVVLREGVGVTAKPLASRLSIPLSEADHAQAEKYLVELLRDRFNTTDLLAVSAEPRPRHNGPDRSDLELVMFTLAARINDLRKSACLTIAEMETLAGINRRGAETRSEPEPEEVMA